MMSKDKVVLDYYAQRAREDGDSALSTIGDSIIREREVDLIRSFLRHVSRRARKSLSVLDAGCGNGYALGLLVGDALDCRFHGLEYSPEMLQVANDRRLECELVAGDIRCAPFESGMFDIVYTERCLINILDSGEQIAALHEIARILKPGGYYLMIECFGDGLENNNRARAEMSLPAIDANFHNLYFDKSVIDDIRAVLTLVDPSGLDPDRRQTRMRLITG